MRDDELSLIKLELDRQSPVEHAPSQLAHQIESIAAASRTLETALLRERAYSKQLREYANQLLTRMHFLQKQENEVSERLKAVEGSSQANAKQVQELSAELQKTKQELFQYRHAWSQVLTREKQAQAVLAKGDASAKRIQELEIALSTIEKRMETEKNGREKAESHAQSHRQELQATLVRLHSSEARFNDMARELEAMHTMRKNHAFELSRAELNAREKLELQFSREKEQLVHELSREREELARHRSELERIRKESESAKELVRRELESKFAGDLQRFRTQSEAQFENEKARALEAQRESLKRAHDAELAQEMGRMESIVRTLGEESKQLKKDLSDARTEVELIEESSRETQLELLKAREETVSLQKKLSEEQARKAEFERSAQSAERRAEETDRRAEEAGRRVEELEKKLQEAERARTLSSQSLQELCELIQDDRKQLQRIAERLVETWGDADPALREALEAIRAACEVKTVRTEAPPAKLEIVTPSSRLNC